MSSIVSRQHRFYVDQSPFAHDFLVLLDDDGRELSQLHGLPYDSKGEQMVKGRSSDYLRVTENPRWPLDHAAEQTLWQGPHDEAMGKWKSAKAAGNEINRRNLTYNLAGSDLNGPRDWDAPAPDVIVGNSNSVFRTLVDSMDLKMPNLPYMAPGIQTPLIRGGLLGQLPQPDRGLLAPGKRGLLGPI